MTAHNFAYWLDGFLIGKESLNKEDLSLVKTKLDLILNYPSSTITLGGTMGGFGTPNYTPVNYSQINSQPFNNGNQ